jgi:hypothetical protein
MGRWVVGPVCFALVLLVNVPQSHAASMTMKRTSTGGGTIVHDGSGNVSTTDQSADGTTSTWTELGYESASDFLVVGGYPLEVFDDPGLLPLFPYTTLTGLRFVATVPIDDCVDCSTLDDATFGLLAPAEQGIRNVALYGDMVALAPVSGPLPTQMVAGASYLFGLSAADVNLLNAVVTHYGADNVRIGLSAAVLWPNDAFPGYTQGLPGFETTTVPEPASMTLFAVGVASMLAAKRRRRTDTRA